ncbi:MAG TPA: hypothetical protein VEC56_09050 [Candidatus Krumholzibacteria bacterium]|nr:hypothetical protein [Candidatus Krumholzibacteria bacterium]
MIPIQIRRWATRVGRGAGFACVLAAFVIAACSSDPISTLGSDSELINSKPGVIVQDTLELFADTVLTYYTALAADTVLEFGRVSGYQRSMVIQNPFSTASSHAAKVVSSAVLRLTASDVDGTFPARFYRLNDTYAEGDSIPTLDTLAVIDDPDTGSPNRTLQTIPRDYPLPPALVQGWIRDEIERTALAVIYNDDVNDKIATFKARQNADSDRYRPQIFVNFVGGTSATFRCSADATFVRPTTATSNLVVSDGFVRRIHLRIPLDQLPERSAVHNARVRLYLVPGSTLGSNPNLVVFIPASDDPTSTEFLTGQLVTATSFQASADYVEFAMTNAIALILQGTLANNGIVVRFDAENSELRQVQFYGSSAPDSLRPRVFITSSTPADFDPPRGP